LLRGRRESATLSAVRKSPFSRQRLEPAAPNRVNGLSHEAATSLPDAGPVRGGDLPEYVFTIRCGGRTLAPARVVACNDDDEALGHACAMVRKLRKDGGYNDPNLMMNVFDDRRPFVFCLPFLPARA
jgi:hypothetical protein